MFIALSIYAGTWRDELPGMLAELGFLILAFDVFLFWNAAY